MGGIFPICALWKLFKEISKIDSTAKVCIFTDNQPPHLFGSYCTLCLYKEMYDSF